MAADTILGRIAQTVGATEPALRLLISILIGKSFYFISFFLSIMLSDESHESYGKNSTITDSRIDCSKSPNFYILIITIKLCSSPTIFMFSRYHMVNLHRTLFIIYLFYFSSYRMFSYRIVN